MRRRIGIIVIASMLALTGCGSVGTVPDSAISVDEHSFKQETLLSYHDTAGVELTNTTDEPLTVDVTLKAYDSSNNYLGVYQQKVRCIDGKKTYFVYTDGTSYEVDHVKCEYTARKTSYKHCNINAWTDGDNLIVLDNDDKDCSYCKVVVVYLDQKKNIVGAQTVDAGEIPAGEKKSFGLSAPRGTASTALFADSVR